MTGDAPARTRPGVRSWARLSVLAILPIGALIAAHLMLTAAGITGSNYGAVMAAAVLLALVVAMVIFYRSATRGGRAASADQRVQTRAWAAGQGWQVREDAEVAHEQYPDRVLAPTIVPQRCLQVIEGAAGPHRVRIESWEVGHSPAGAPYAVADRRQIVSVPAHPQVPAVAFLDAAAARYVLRYVPRALAESPLGRPLMSLWFAADARGEQVKARMEPVLPAAQATGVRAVITAPGVLSLVFADEAPPAGLAQRVDAAVAVAAALG